MSLEETLSAMHDDEAQEIELRRVLKAIDGQPELRARWRRQQLVSSALRGEAVQFSGTDISAGVMAALENDAVPAAPQATWRRALGGMAVAASVTAVVVFGGSQLANDPAAVAARVGPLPVGVVNSSGAVPVQASFGNRSLPAVQPMDSGAYRELARQRLLRYSQEHAEHAALNTPAGMVPFARVPVIEPQ